MLQKPKFAELDGETKLSSSSIYSQYWAEFLFYDRTPIQEEVTKIPQQFNIYFTIDIWKTLQF